ncbi:hypothetical protein C8R44DRAFT_168836 [Mycena epipterygia]|nr:hypothetical protein C8R44DRAFT_168836 [Mycena epipterygia]
MRPGQMSPRWDAGVRLLHPIIFYYVSMDDVAAHAQHATLPFLAAHAASIASPRTVPFPTAYHPHRSRYAPAVLRGTPFTTSCIQSARYGPFPSPAPAIASSYTKGISSKQNSPRPRARFRGFPARHSPPLTCFAHGAAAPHRPYRVDHLPARRRHFQRLIALLETSPVRHPTYYVAHRRRAQQVRRAFSAPYAAFIAFSRTAHPLRRRGPPPETSTSRAPFPPGLRPRGTYG